MQIGVSSYSYVQSPLDIFEVIQEAKKTGFDAALPILVEGCRAITKFGAELGIKTMVETYGFFCQDSERVEKLVNGVDHPNFPQRP